MYTQHMTHIVQSPEWGEFKTKYGTKTVRVGNIQYTVHKMPFTDNYYAYCPKVDPFEINWNQLEESLKQNNCFVINFDIPNVIAGTEESKRAEEILKQKGEPSPKDTFAKHNLLLDLTKPEEEIFAKFHTKNRYNIRYAQKSGVKVRQGTSDKDFEVFYELLKDTSIRQKYYIHPKEYYELIWKLLQPKGIAHILLAGFNKEVLASWMLLTYENVLYYPYGGSAAKLQNLFPSNLIGWEAIRFGKLKECHSFDMWGAAEDLQNKEDPWYGFTSFKIKFGAKHVQYIDSYDFILNKTIHILFNTANDLRWKILKVLK